MGSIPNRIQVIFMKKRRKTQNIKNLTNSPGKLTQALDITVKDNGTDLIGSHLWIEEGGGERLKIVSSRRIGIKVGKELKLIFYIEGDENVSRKY